MKCKHSGECDMNPGLMQILQSVRDEHAKPIFISSGYRARSHPVESMKDKAGEHTLGLAVDIICYGHKAIELTELFFQRGIRRFGFHQKGNHNARYIHVGLADKFFNEFPVAIWTY